MWDKVVEKAVNEEAKARIQSPSKTKKIDSRYPKSYWSLDKKNKDDANQEHRDKVFKDKKKAKSHNSSFDNQPQIYVSKKHYRSWWGGYPATGVNVIKVIKKDKDKVKDLSHIECYTCKQKGYYAKKCPKKSKN